jgi:DNA-binding MarR family transcriptional regulator
MFQYVLNELYMTQSSAQSVRDEFVDRMGHAAESDGLSPIAGRLFGALLLSEDPQSLDDLAASLGVSKASVSTEARRLLDRGIVERVSNRGDRRDYYELAPDFFAQVIRSRVARWRRLHDLVNRVNAAPGLSPVVRDRMASIDEIHSFVVDRITVALAEWERRPSVRRTRQPKRQARGA